MFIDWHIGASGVDIKSDYLCNYMHVYMAEIVC